MAQSTQNTPLARMKAGFGSKKDLIEKIKGMATAELWSDRLNSDKGWGSISNAKLLRLHAVISDVKARFGSRDALVDALIAAEGRSKDGDYKKHFATWPLPRLLDALKSVERRNKAKGVAPATPAAKAPAAEKPAVKKAAAEPAAEAKPAVKKGAAKKAAASAEEKPAAKKTVAKKAAAEEKPVAKKTAAKKTAKKGA